MSFAAAAPLLSHSSQYTNYFLTDLVWLCEEEPPLRPLTPVVTVHPSTPSPEIVIEPFERRMRKAKGACSCACTCTYVCVHLQYKSCTAYMWGGGSKREERDVQVKKRSFECLQNYLDRHVQTERQTLCVRVQCTIHVHAEEWNLPLVDML